MSGSGNQRNQGPFPWGVHPIWRGIGLLFLVIVPIISIGIAGLILPQLGDELPDYLTQTVILPGFGEVEKFPALALLTLVLSVSLFLLTSIIASIAYSMLGGHRNEELARFTKKYRNDR